jgi:hypothetical protein
MGWSLPVAFQYPDRVARFVRCPVAYLRSCRLKKYHSRPPTRASSEDPSIPEDKKKTVMDSMFQTNIIPKRAGDAKRRYAEMKYVQKNMEVEFVITRQLGVVV